MAKPIKLGTVRSTLVLLSLISYFIFDALARPSGKHPTKLE